MERSYPQTPLVGVGVVVRKDQHLLLVKRAHEPKKGLWAIPGGLVQLGESIRQAAIREVMEECSIQIQLQDVISVVDLIDKDEAGKVKFHFVLIDFLADYTAGELKPASDAAAGAWVSRAELDAYEIPEITRKVIAKAF